MNVSLIKKLVIRKCHAVEFVAILTRIALLSNAETREKANKFAAVDNI